MIIRDRFQTYYCNIRKCPTDTIQEYYFNDFWHIGIYTVFQSFSLRPRRARFRREQLTGGGGGRRYNIIIYL